MKETLNNFKIKPNPDEPVAARRKSRFIGELKIEDCKLNICRLIIRGKGWGNDKLYRQQKNPSQERCFAL
jgi:hypothetical protein